MTTGSFLNSTPQPGDGAWLVGRSRRKYDQAGQPVSFLRNRTQQNESRVILRPQGAGTTQHKTFLRSRGRNDAEPTSFTEGTGGAIPRTIANENLLSTPPHPSPAAENDKLLTIPSQPIPPSYLLEGNQISINEGEMGSVATTKALPPHLRKKNKKAQSSDPTPPFASNQGGVDESLQCTGRPDRSRPRPSSPKAVQEASIRERLESEHGVRVISTPQSTKATPSKSQSSNKASKPFQGGGAKVHHHASPTSEPKRGRGRGGHRGDNLPRQSCWPKNSDMQADPKRWEIKWENDSFDSACAIDGFGDGKTMNKPAQNGIDPDTGFILTDWSGNWAPAPVDWDARPAFRDGQSAERIDKWLHQIDEEMCGKTWAVPMKDVVVESVTYCFAPNPEDLSKMIQGDPAPRYWIPIVFGDQAPRTFWNDVIVKSKVPELIDEDDLDGAQPWWETYQVAGGYFLKPYQHPDIKGISPGEEDEDERLARENDFGSNRHAENRRQKELAKEEVRKKRDEKRREKFGNVSKADLRKLKENKIKPGIKLNIRFAKAEDIARICEIYNYYVDFSVCTPETQRQTEGGIQQRLNEIRGNKLPFLVACERGEKIKGRRNRGTGEDIVLPDKVVGFAFADGYNGMQGMYRFTAELEFYVDKDYYMKGVAKCLLDKLMGVLDPCYLEKGGYEAIGEDVNGGAGVRRISTLIVHVPYDKDKPDRVEWIEKWLSTWLGFERIGTLLEVGLKLEKTVNLAIFQHKTGENIDPKQLPVMVGDRK